MDLKSLLHLGKDHDEKKKDEKKENETTDIDSNNKDKEFVGSGIFTADGKELPAIEGGYDLVDPDSGLGDNEFD